MKRTAGIILLSWLGAGVIAFLLLVLMHGYGYAGEAWHRVSVVVAAGLVLELAIRGGAHWWRNR